jgi:GTPase SAR1 family protein
MLVVVTFGVPENMFNCIIFCYKVWDTAGQERFRSMAPMYYRNSNAALIVFDITQYETFQAMKGWVKGTLLIAQ